MAKRKKSNDGLLFDVVDGDTPQGPTDEHVTVLSGSMVFGMGDTMDAKTEKTVTRGGYFVAQANMHHYAVAKSPAVIQVDLEGPFDITYINPADDPRNAKK